MPTYEYACKDCGSHLEVVQAFTEDALTECPSCSGRLRKVFGSIGISFKGSGFYKTDSRSTPSSTKTGDGAGSTTTDGSGSEPTTTGDKGGGTATETKEKPKPAADTSSSGTDGGKAKKTAKKSEPAKTAS